MPPMIGFNNDCESSLDILERLVLVLAGNSATPSLAIAPVN